MISLGKSVCILRYVKLQRAKKELHTASISHTVHVCSAQQSQAVSAFSGKFDEVTLNADERCYKEQLMDI